MRFNIIHNDPNADPMRKGKTRRRNEHPRWPVSLKAKVENILGKKLDSVQPEGGAK